MPRTFAALFGSKCLPDEEPKPAEPKFNLGDKAILKGYVCTITSRVYEQGKFVGYKIEYPLLHGNATVPESDLEPYTEPEEESRNLSQETANCDKQFDNILKDGFSKERRLNIAAMAMQAIISRGKGYDAQEVAIQSLEYADALIKEAEKGGRG